MRRSYVETTEEDTLEPTIFTVIMKAAWACAAAGKTFGEEELKAGLVADLGLSAQLAEGWARGVDVLSAYVVSEETGDALDEESQAVEVSRKATLPVLEARLQARVDRIDKSFHGAVRCSIHGCDAPCASRGIEPRTRLSKLGPLTTRRRWSSCAEHGGFAAADRALLLPAADYTGEVEAAAAMLSTVTTFGVAEKLLAELLGLNISAHALQKMTHDRGQYAERANDDEAAAYNPFKPDGLPKRECPRPSSTAKPPKLAYIEVDGVVPMTRELDAARSAPVPGARGGKGLRYDLIGREVKNAVLYDGADCVQLMDSRGSVLEKTYVSRLGNWVPFALTLWTSVLRLRFDQAEKLVLLSDGAEWIRGLAAWMPCDVFLILDLFHAKKRIWEVARALWPDEKSQTRWAKLQCARVEEGRVDTVLETLERLQRKRSRIPNVVGELQTYFENNRDRMDYGAYAAQGLRISSANVESANFHMTGDRLKKQGMRWSMPGAASMCVLRADLFNGRWHGRTREYLRATG